MSVPLTASKIPAKPVVLVPACNRLLGHHPFHIAGKKYVDGVRLAQCQPLIVPSAEPDEIEALLDIADGVLLTGSPSNVHPRHFGEAVLDPTLPLDEQRDAWTLLLVPRVLARGIPLLAICRGAQEANVALGGTLHQAVHEVPPHADHRADYTQPVEVQYGPSHEVLVEPGSLLARITGEPRFRVNSVHGQAVHRLAPGVQVQARAPDGLVEAFSIEAPGFNLCVQWHPEWQAATNPISRQLFGAFGEACAAYRDRHRPPPSA